jgi:hypothetical protein
MDNELYYLLLMLYKQNYRIGSVFGLDPDSMGSLDPDLDSQSGSVSKRDKMAQKNRKQLINFLF